MRNEATDRLFEIAQDAFPPTKLKEIVAQLKTDGADFDALDPKGETIMHYAARTGMLSVVQAFAENGAELSPQNREGDTPLHLAAQGNHAAICKYLIEKGAETDRENKRGVTAAHYEVVRIAMAAIPGREGEHAAALSAESNDPSKGRGA